jgi:hypothetical protein
MHADADVRKIRGYDAGMTRTILLMAALAIGACGGSDDPKPDAAGPHDELACDTASWQNIPVGPACERVCVTRPATWGDTSNPCNATTPGHPGMQLECPGTFTADGVIGCCQPDSAEVTRFWECQ